MERQLEFLFFGRKKTRRTSRAKGKGQPRPGNQHIDPEKTTECAALVRGLAMKGLASRLAVVWNTRMRSSAGRAFWPEGRIELNPKLKEVAPEEIHNTMLHELAHLVAYARAGRRRITAHGAEWRQACHDLGIPGEGATHDLPLPSRTMQPKWRYRCPVCGEGFDRVRRMKRYAGCYSCCKLHNGGYYQRKFRLVETRIG